jgi:purine-binding chemotaxis protein CheW
VISLRGRTIPAHDLASRLGLSTELTDHTKIVIVETAEQTVGAIVDAVDEVLTVEADELEEIPSADRP